DINSTNVQILNSDNPELPQVSTTFNVLIGGNRLGRGVTIGRLLVTYYGRSAKSPQIDTVLQHARMYGYRKQDQNYLKFYTTNTLYGLFSNIHESDRLLRDMVFEKTPNNLHAILLNRTHNTNLRPTRNNVIPLDQISLFLPGTRYFPYTPVHTNIEILNTMLTPYVENNKPVQVEIDFLISILLLAKSDKIGGESWDDEAIRVCLKNMKEQYSNIGYLFVRIDRDIKQGARAMLSEDDAKQFVKDFPTLTMYRYIGSKEKGWDDKPIWVPNLRFPDGQNFFMYTPS
ncbi:MAG: Z1 domain-containing protein, partial [Mobilitalea sp.]